MSIIALRQPPRETLAQINRRRSERHSLALETQMMKRGGKAFSARIMNISLHGFLVDTDIALNERNHVKIDIPTIGWVRADLVWVLGSRVGGEFVEPLSPVRFEMFVGLFGTTPRG